MDIQLKEKLEKAGLTENEALIYSYLIDVGGAYPSAIASATKINRSTVYKTLLQMSIKNLVSEVERGKKLFYQITTSNALVTHARQQIRLAEGMFDAAESLFPKIDDLIKNAGYKPKVQTFEGKDALQKVLEDHIEETSAYEMLSISNAEKLYEHLPKGFFDNYRKEKGRLQITTRGIIPETENNKNFVEKAYISFGIEKKFWPEVKFIDPTLFNQEAEITLYKNRKISIIKLTDQKPIGIIIEDDVIYSMLKMMFEVMWSSK